MMRVHRRYFFCETSLKLYWSFCSLEQTIESQEESMLIYLEDRELGSFRVCFGVRPSSHKTSALSILKNRQLYVSMTILGYPANIDAPATCKVA